MIKSFPIPNTKEDIMEFMILAYTNFDSANYVGKKSSHGLAEAWMVKMDQCKLKAGMLFTSNDPAYISINEMYKKSTDKIADCKKQAGAKHYKRTPDYWVKIIAVAFAVFMTLGSFISGSVPSGLFGVAMTGGTIVSILMGLGTIPSKYPIVKTLVFIAALACFVPLVLFLP
jgi:hypothetical protein